MAEQVDVPGVGRVNQQYVMVGGAAVAGFVAYAYYKRRQGNALPVAVPVVDPSSIPATDYTPPATSGNASGTQDLTGGAIATNSEWAQKATAYLGDVGFDPAMVAKALGAFLTRQGLSADQMEAVRAAVGAFGEPPQGKPWAILPAAAGAGSGPLAAPHNLRVVGSTRNTITLAWDPVPGATQYTIQQGGMGGQWHADWDTTTASQYTVNGLNNPNTLYTFVVRAEKPGTGGQVDNSPSVVITGRTAA